MKEMPGRGQGQELEALNVLYFQQSLHPMIQKVLSFSKRTSHTFEEVVSIEGVS